MLKHNFRQLKIWSDSVKLAKQVYLLTQTFPNEHKFGLSSQIYRSAVSISSNIAEGISRSSQKEFSHFLKISLGSAFELETQLVIGHDCELINSETFNQQIGDLQAIQRQIVAFNKTLACKMSLFFTSSFVLHPLSLIFCPLSFVLCLNKK